MVAKKGIGGDKLGKAIAFRLPIELTKAIRAFQLKLAKDVQGMNVSMTDALRILLIRGLKASGDDVEKLYPRYVREGDVDGEKTKR